MTKETAFKLAVYGAISYYAFLFAYARPQLPLSPNTASPQFTHYSDWLNCPDCWACHRDYVFCCLHSSCICKKARFLIRQSEDTLFLVGANLDKNIPMTKLLKIIQKEYAPIVHDLYHAFAIIKKKMEISQDIFLIFHFEDMHCADSKPGCAKHEECSCVYICLNRPLHNNTRRTRYFILAHELAHIKQQHVSRWATCDAQTKRECEYEADRIAALSLEEIEGALEDLGAVPDASSPLGWKLLPDRCYGYNANPDDSKDESQHTHPSNANRCRALLALKENYPEKFQTKLFELSTKI